MALILLWPITFFLVDIGSDWPTTHFFVITADNDVLNDAVLTADNFELGVETR